MGLLSFVTTENSAGVSSVSTLEPSGMKSWIPGPTPARVIHEEDPDGMIGKPLGQWGGQTGTAIIHEEAATFAAVVAKRNLWLAAYNSKGTLTVEQDNVETEYTKMRLTGVEPNRRDATNYDLTLTFVQEVD